MFMHNNKLNFVKQLGEVAFGTRLRLLTDRFTQDGVKIYQSQNIDFEPRWFTMFYLLSKRSPLSISEITRELGFTQPAVTQIANILLKKGLVKIVKHKEDTRKKMLSLSHKGISLLPSLEPVWESFEEAVRELFASTGYDVLLMIEKLETALDEKDMYERVTKKIKLKQSEGVEIIDYAPGYKNAFRDLNFEWLEKYFKIESEDRKLLEDPETEIIQKGGSIFFAIAGKEVLGTAALIRHDDNSYELAKMAVTEKAQGRQIGKRLAEAVLNKAKELKLNKIFLETNNKLIPAMNLYHKLGFRETEYNKPSKYERSTIMMELIF
jgi:DNA-binding MarR family transcriptional regulator/GNAT superfamily N-acetyltransferase